MSIIGYSGQSVVLDKTDFKKTLEAYRARQGRFQVIEVPEMQYLMVDGHGDSNTSPAIARRETSRAGTGR